MSANPFPSQFHADRAKGLGASESAAACGVSRWDTSLRLWRKKTGIATAEEYGQEEIYHAVGKALEPVVIDYFQRQNKEVVVDRQLKIVDPTWDRRWVTLDGRTQRDGAHVEAKSVGVLSPKDWGHEMEDDAIPNDYYFQCQHGFGCNPDAPYAWVPLIILNRQVRIYRVQRNPELIQSILEVEKRFMDYVDRREPPPPRDMDDCKLLWPSHMEGMRTPASEADAEIVGRFRDLKAQSKTLEREQDAIKLMLAERMGDNAELVFLGTPILTYKKAKDTIKFDEDAFAADHPATYENYLTKKQQGSRRMLIKGG